VKFSPHPIKRIDAAAATRAHDEHGGGFLRIDGGGVFVTGYSPKDYVTRDLFEMLMHGEEERIDFLETQLDLIGKLGLGLYAQHHLGGQDHDPLTHGGS
jgi:hypothetical protein